MKKKVINILTAFFIFHKNDIKIFLKWFINSILRTFVSKTQPLNVGLFFRNFKREMVELKSLKFRIFFFLKFLKVAI